jgi:hypothetical protein
MEKIIQIFDLYGKNVSLYTKSSTKAASCIGLVFTIISYLLLVVIFYIECYEVLKRENPNVVSYKHDKNNNNSTLSLSNNTFNFYLNFISDIGKDDILNYFDISSFIQFDDSDFFNINVSFEICNDNDKSNFRNKIDNFKFPHYGINFCPRIHYGNTETLKEFYKFNFYYTISECSKQSLDCTVNNDLYKKIREAKSYLYAKLIYINNEIDFTNYDNPYWTNLREFDSWSSYTDGTVIELEGSEIRSKSLFSFNQPAVKTEFSYLRAYKNSKQATEFVSFNIRFYSNDMYIYIRTYKTFNVALATSFSLFNLFHKVLSIILSPLYRYYMNTIIINKNFSYDLSTQSGGVINNNEVSAERGISAELINVRPKKLTTISALKNVSLFRYILCKRRNKTKTFYDQAKNVIYKNLSVENLLQFLIEYYRLKKFLDNKIDASEYSFNYGEYKLILNDKVKDKKADLQLEALVNSNSFITNDFK